MVNISDLSNDEIKYICELMYLPSVRRYLQKNIKEFNRIRPGFTVKKMSDEDILSFLIKYSHKSLVQDLIRVVVQEWLVQIQDNISELVNQGFSSGEALIKTIPDCVFAERIELYFKLSDQPYDDKYLELLSDALSLVKRTSTTALQEHNSEIVSEEIQAANNEIEKLNNQLADREQCEKTMQQALDDANESILQYQAQITEFDERFRRMEAESATIKSELDRYTMLERYIDDSGNITQFSQFQHTSIGKVIYDYNRAGYLQKYIIRLADISDDGTIKLFTKDRNLPHYFDNRDRLHCNDGPEEENSIGVWNWSATPRDTDPEKDYVKTQFSYDNKITQIVHLVNCESLDDVVYRLKGGLSIRTVCRRILFVYEEDSILNGLLCLEKDFDRISDKVALKVTVYTLPHYCIQQSDEIELAGIRVLKRLSLGIPKSIHQVRDPYEAVKSLILSRVTNAALREYELSKKEIQRCRSFLKAIPTQTVIQELTLAYNCSNEKAQEYIDGFISLADTYLSAADIDTTIISRAIQANADLLDLCKQQLTDEWKAENHKQLAEAELKLNEVSSSAESKQKEIDQLAIDRDKLSAEMEQLQSVLNQREQLASEVETKISMQIEKAKQNIADFISNMAFVSQFSSHVVPNGKQLSDQFTVFNTHIDCVENGKIDDIDTFEDELSENLTRIGYDNEKSIDISQAICFAICEKVSLVISENAKLIAQCLAAVLNGGTVSEVFIPIQGICIEELSKAINANVGKASPMICLIHGIFDSYSINLFNALSNIMQNWDNVIILLSSEGTPTKMLMPGVWNRSIFIDGDSGFEKKTVEPLRSYTILDSLSFHDRTIDMKSKEYRNSKKTIMLFTEILSCTQIGMYSRYLTLYNTLLNDSNLILTQLIATARSIGNTERLKELFHENGINSGDELLRDSKK